MPSREAAPSIGYSPNFEDTIDRETIGILKDPAIGHFPEIEKYLDGKNLALPASWTVETFLGYSVAFTTEEVLRQSNHPLPEGTIYHITFASPFDPASFYPCLGFTSQSVDNITTWGNITLPVGVSLKKQTQGIENRLIGLPQSIHVKLDENETVLNPASFVTGYNGNREFTPLTQNILSRFEKLITQVQPQAITI
jgi:hypothetical protein